MKTTQGLMIFLALGNFAVAADRPTAVPQPRVRLDPVTRIAVPASKAESAAETAAPAVMMSPMVVKSTLLPAEDPAQEKQPEGPFSLLEGGWLYAKDLKHVRVEVGVWPYRNIMWKSDRFKSDLRHVGTEFVRVSW